MILALFLLIGCGSDVAVLVETAECTDYDFDAPENESMEVTAVDGDWHVSHKGVFHGCADLFDPDISGKRKVLTVREYWEERTEDDCTVCFAPTIIIEQPPAGSYEVGWYVEDASSPYDVVSFEVE